MNGIIFNTEQECINLISLIDTNVSFLFKGLTTTYTYHIEHPLNGTFAVIINIEDFIMLQTEYPNLIGNIGFDFADNIVSMDKEEWLPFPDDI